MLGRSTIIPARASTRRWKLTEFAGSSIARARSAARACPSTASSVRIRCRSGCAIARSAAGSWTWKVSSTCRG
ncbi:hypothetical protein BJF88_11390 [Cellulosimicrobium sp. CUA-896]|nr:hypothetical protein BJF88_11390 [Cellulosimicrobium sp. CUA-896]